MRLLTKLFLAVLLCVPLSSFAFTSYFNQTYTTCSGQDLMSPDSSYYSPIVPTTNDTTSSPSEVGTIDFTNFAWNNYTSSNCLTIDEYIPPPVTISLDRLSIGFYSPIMASPSAVIFKTPDNSWSGSISSSTIKSFSVSDVHSGIDGAYTFGLTFGYFGGVVDMYPFYIKDGRFYENISDIPTSGGGGSEYNGPGYGDWLMVAGVIIGMLGILVWPRIFRPIKTLFYGN